MRTGVVFVSTGGPKILRAIHSLHVMDPHLTIHVLMDTTTNTWMTNSSNPSLSELVKIPYVKTLPLMKNKGMVNGAFNAAVKWMDELGYSHACCLHDDIVFSPLPENYRFLQRAFQDIDSNPELKEASGVAFGHFEALVFWPGNVKYQPGNWHRDPAEWAKLDLEARWVWERLCPGGYPEHDVDFPEMNFFTLYEGLRDRTMLRYSTRLGPTGFVIPIIMWKRISGFDEEFGIFYDIMYPSECAVRGYNPIIVYPNSPFLHLHNQTQAFGDPLTGIWSDTLRGFREKYKMDNDTFWSAHKDWLYEGIKHEDFIHS